MNATLLGISLPVGFQRAGQGIMHCYWYWSYLTR